MNIIKATNESRALSIMLVKRPLNCGPEVWERLQFIRTWLLTYYLKHNGK